MHPLFIATALRSAACQCVATITNNSDVTHAVCGYQQRKIGGYMRISPEEDFVAIVVAAAARRAAAQMKKAGDATAEATLLALADEFARTRERLP
jgi:hypothetical protein